jgi:hypothetical protein
MKDQAVLFRDAAYGALALLRTENGVRTVDFGFDVVDFAPVLEALHRYGREVPGTDGRSSEWHLTTHREAVIANVESMLRRRGYGDDPLGARYVSHVSEAATLAPDVPTDAKSFPVPESVSRALGSHVDLAVAAVGAKVVESKFFARPSATDRGGRPLPFLRVRALAPIGEGADACTKKLREALTPALGPSLVRATAELVRDKLAIEFAVAPPAAVVESFVHAELPVFESIPIVGTREVTFVLPQLVLETEFAGLRDRAMACSAITEGRVLDERTIGVRVPSAREGDPVMDQAFGTRLSWLSAQLPYEARAAITSRVDEMRVNEAGKVNPRADAPSPADIPGTVDGSAVTELAGFVARGQDTNLRRQETVIADTLKKRMSSGAFDMTGASKAYSYLVNAAVESYGKLAGSGSKSFGTNERRYLAYWYAQRFEARVAAKLI